MLAALHLHEQTGDARWRDLWRRCADTLLDDFRTDPEHGCRIWIQYRRGRLIRSIGPGTRLRLERPHAAAKRALARRGAHR